MKNKGFTLIELLVVLAIIAIVSTLVYISINESRVKSRDARRKSDLQSMAAALEQYYAEKKAFPVILPNDYQELTPGLPSGNPLVTALVGGGFLASMPSDPLKNTTVPYVYIECGRFSGSCDNSIPSTITQYAILAKLEKDPEKDADKFWLVTNSILKYYTFSATGKTYNYWVSSR